MPRKFQEVLVDAQLIIGLGEFISSFMEGNKDQEKTFWSYLNLLQFGEEGSLGFHKAGQAELEAVDSLCEGEGDRIVLSLGKLRYPFALRLGQGKIA